MAHEAETLEQKPFVAYLPIAISCIVVALLIGGFSGAMSLFLPLMANDYGVPVSAIAIYMSIGGLLMALFGPVLGSLFVKFDVRIVASSLVVIQCLCFLSLATSGSSLQVIVTGAIMYPTGLLSVTLYFPTIINRWFKDSSGAVLGAAAAMTGIGGAIWLMVGQAIVTAYDYRTAFYVFAVLALVCLPFTAIVNKAYPSQRGMLPYISNKSTSESVSAAQAVAEKNWSVNPGLALKSLAFWMLVLAIFCAQSTVMIAQYFPTYVNTLTSAGVSAFVTGAVVSSCLMIGQAIFKFVLGAAVDRSVNGTVFAVMAGAIVGILCMWLSPTTPLLPIGGFLFGLIYAAPAVLNALIAGKCFGTGPNYAVIWGRSMLPSGILTAPMPTLWPWLAENFGGYGIVFCCGIVLICLYGILLLSSVKAAKNLPHETIEIGIPLEEAVEHADELSKQHQLEAEKATEGAAATTTTAAASSEETREKETV